MPCKDYYCIPDLTAVAAMGKPANKSPKGKAAQAKAKSKAALAKGKAAQEKARKAWRKLQQQGYERKRAGKRCSRPRVHMERG